MRVRLLAALALVCLSASLALAQATDPLLYVAGFDVKPGKEKAFLDLVKKWDQPVFEKLAAGGAVMSWGIDATILHGPGTSSMDMWFILPDMGGLDRVYAAWDAMDERIAAEDEKAAAAAKAAGKAAPRSTMDRILEVGDFAKHQDRLFRVLVTDGRPTEAKALPYIAVTYGRALPGKAQGYRAAWEKYFKPIYAKLLADGTIVGYGLSTEEVKTTDAYTHLSWVTMPNLAARDKVRAAILAPSPAERDQRMKDLLDVGDPTATRGAILRSIIFNVAPPQR
jgi:hypothetical protein